MTTERLLTRAELAEHLKISPSKLRRIEPNLPRYPIGPRSYRFLLSEVLAHFREQPQHGGRLDQDPNGDREQA